MTQYLLNVIEPTGGQLSPEQLEPIIRDVTEVDNEMKAKGVWLFAGGLHDPSSSTVVRVEDGEALTTDGPFAEGKEHIGGFSVIEAPDLDSALEWARKLAKATTLPIEVRPFRQGPGEHP
jgi:hypothetical protein